MDRLAGALAIASGMIHFYAAPAHFAEEGLAFGLFMLAVGAVQLAVGELLLQDPGRVPVRSAAIGTLAVLLLYAVSRTSGLPFGPHPGLPEPVGPVDVLSKAIEAALLALLLRRLRPRADRNGARHARVAGARAGDNLLHADQPAG